MANYSFSTSVARAPRSFRSQRIVERAPRSLRKRENAIPAFHISNQNQIRSRRQSTSVCEVLSHSRSDRGARSTISTNTVWDDAGRMRNTNVPAGATAGIQGLNENGYVGGNRIWKKITRSGSVVEHRVHVHAGPNLIAEYNAGVAASTPVQEYVYAGEIDSLVLIRRSNGTKYGVSRNRQWSVVALHDLANGDVVERYAYEMTGKRTIYAANGTTVRTKSSYGNNFGYTNRWHDEESGLMYFRARYYNPLTGEFLSRDPLEFVDGMSLYQGYFILNRVDATGLTTTWRYHVNWIRLIDGRSASYHVNLSIFLPDAADRPEPGVNPQKIKKLQLWQINTRKGFYVKQKDGACERVPVDVRTIDIGNLDATHVQKDENGKEYVIDDSLWIMNDDEICFAFIQVKKKVGFNSATDVLKNGMFDNPTDSFWNHVKDKMRPPFATYYSDYFFIKPECKCCFPEWLHWIFLTDKGFEAIDANGTIKRSAI